MHSLSIKSGTTLDLSVGVGVGPMVTVDKGVLTPDGCLMPGDSLLVCSCETACPQPASCYAVAADGTITPALPAGKSKVMKAANLQGFALVFRLGDGEQSYLNVGAACKDSDRAIVQGCHDVEVGDLLSLAGAFVDVPIAAALPGESNGKNFTVIITQNASAGEVALSENEIVTVKGATFMYSSRDHQCGVLRLVIPPAQTARYPKGRTLPFTLMLEQSWDYSEFNRVHGVDCVPDAGWANLIASGYATIA